MSVASYWEIAIKAGKGLLDISDRVSWWDRAVQLLGAGVLPIHANHVGALARLPAFGGPFDRILIAQAVAEGLPLVTSDQQIAAYPRSAWWARWPRAATGAGVLLITAALVPARTRASPAL